MKNLLIAVLATASFTAAAPAQAHSCDTHCRELKTIQPYIPWLRSTGACETGSRNLHRGLRVRSTYRGRYQFSFQTWRGAGGHGDPADASWLEQGYRAVKWRRIIGNPHSTAGWPVCG